MTKNLKIDLIALLAEELDNLDNDKFNKLFEDEDFDSMDFNDRREKLKDELYNLDLLDSFDELNEKLNDVFYPEEVFNANELIREKSLYKDKFEISNYCSHDFTIRINKNYKTYIWVQFNNNSYELSVHYATLDNASWGKIDKLRKPTKEELVNKVDELIKFYFENKELYKFI